MPSPTKFNAAAAAALNPRSHLRSLALERAPRLKDRSLASASLHRRLERLTSLSLAECPGVTGASLSAIAQLTGLQALDIAGARACSCELACWHAGNAQLTLSNPLALRLCRQACAAVDAFRHHTRAHTRCCPPARRSRMQARPCALRA